MAPEERERNERHLNLDELREELRPSAVEFVEQRLLLADIHITTWTKRGKDCGAA